MADIQVKVHCLSESAALPQRMTDEAAGFDLCASEDAVIPNTNVRADAYVVHTGVALDIPKGYHGKIFLRSSTGLKTKLRLANGTGVIDSDYKGEILLLMENNARQYQTIHRGDRIAQILIEKNADVEFVEAGADEAPKPSAHKGLGSTGRKAK